MIGTLWGLNFTIKVLGKELEEKPFFKRVFFNIYIELLCREYLKTKSLFLPFPLDKRAKLVYNYFPKL